jgi:hypothetical protein
MAFRKPKIIKERLTIRKLWNKYRDTVKRRALNIVMGSGWFYYGDELEEYKKVVYGEVNDNLAIVEIDRLWKVVVTLYKDKFKIRVVVRDKEVTHDYEHIDQIKKVRKKILRRVNKILEGETEDVKEAVKNFLKLLLS